MHKNWNLLYVFRGIFLAKRPGTFEMDFFGMDAVLFALQAERGLVMLSTSHGAEYSCSTISRVLRNEVCDGRSVLFVVEF